MGSRGLLNMSDRRRERVFGPPDAHVSNADFGAVFILLKGVTGFALTDADGRIPSGFDRPPLKCVGMNQGAVGSTRQDLIAWPTEGRLRHEKRLGALTAPPFFFGNKHVSTRKRMTRLLLFGKTPGTRLHGHHTRVAPKHVERLFCRDDGASFCRRTQAADGFAVWHTVLQRVVGRETLAFFTLGAALVFPVAIATQERTRTSFV